MRETPLRTFSGTHKTKQNKTFFAVTTRPLIRYLVVLLNLTCPHADVLIGNDIILTRQHYLPTFTTMFLGFLPKYNSVWFWARRQTYSCLHSFSSLYTIVLQKLHLFPTIFKLSKHIVGEIRIFWQWSRVNLVRRSAFYFMQKWFYFGI